MTGAELLGYIRTGAMALRWISFFMPSPRITTAEALDHIISESAWGRRNAAAPLLALAAIDELERALREWRWLDAEGFLRNASVAEKLPPDYWREVQLDREDHLAADRRPHCRTVPLPPGRRHAVENVTLRARAVWLRWPRPIAGILSRA